MYLFRITHENGVTTINNAESAIDAENTFKSLSDDRVISVDQVYLYYIILEKGHKQVLACSEEEAVEVSKLNREDIKEIKFIE